MKQNIGTTDRAIRIIFGLFLLSLTMWGPQTLWGLIGIVPIVTAFVRVCPAYMPFNITTNKETVKTEKM
jgi:hypothetical protein